MNTLASKWLSCCLSLSFSKENCIMSLFHHQMEQEETVNPSFHEMGKPLDSPF